MGVVQRRTLRDARDLLERADQTGRLPGELHRRRVRQPLALPADRGLDEPGEELADEAEDEQRDSDHCEWVAALAVAAATAELQEPQAHQTEQQDAVEQSDQPDVEPHVTVEDVAE